jgi:hypothetical protein
LILIIILLILLFGGGFGYYRGGYHSRVHRQHPQSAHALDIRPACSQFFSWCEQRGLTLVAIRP